MAIVYKVKHLPTGLWYKPGSTNLDPVGKIYNSKSTMLSSKGEYTGIRIRVQKNTKVYKEYGERIEWEAKMRAGYRSNAREVSFITSKEDWELEKYNETVAYELIRE